MSTKNKRHLFDDNDNKVYDRVKYIAAEGSVLTLIGKISYDITLDEFSLTDSLGFVGGGLIDSITTLSNQYSKLMSYATTLFLVGFIGFSVGGFFLFLQNQM